MEKIQKNLNLEYSIQFNDDYTNIVCDNINYTDNNIVHYSVKYDGYIENELKIKKILYEYMNKQEKKAMEILEIDDNNIFEYIIDGIDFNLKYLDITDKQKEKNLKIIENLIDKLELYEIEAKGYSQGDFQVFYFITYKKASQEIINYMEDLKYYFTSGIGFLTGNIEIIKEIDGKEWKNIEYLDNTIIYLNELYFNDEEKDELKKIFISINDLDLKDFDKINEKENN